MREGWFSANDAVDRHEGHALLPARTIVLKSLLEIEPATALLAGPTGGGLSGLFGGELASDVAEVLVRHGLLRVATPDGTRAIDLTATAAATGSPAVAWVPWRDVAAARRALRAAATRPLPRGSALLLLLEDAPSEAGSACPIATAREAGLPTLVAPDLGSLRDLLDVGLRGSRACRRAFGLVLHTSLTAAAETCELFPNRASPPAELTLARGRLRRRPVPPDDADALRVVRRAELNRIDGMPSPGERVPVGFVTAGPASPALEHLVEVLALRGRVPHVALAATHPLDEAVIERLLERCEHVVVLEPRPGTTEPEVLRVAEAIRRRGGRAAAVWARGVPVARAAEAGAAAAVPVIDPTAEPRPIGPDDAVHPSRLARRIVDLLHVIRPGGRLAERLAVEPRVGPPAVVLDEDAEEIEDRPADAEDAVGVAVPRPMPPRSQELGATAAVRIVRDAAAEVDQRLRHRTPTEEELEEGRVPPSELLVDRWIPASVRRPVAIFEVWSARRFAIEGAAAVRQASRDGRPWVIAVCDVARGDAPDPRRLAAALGPSDREAEVRVAEARLDDRRQLVAAILEAALGRGVCVLVVREEQQAVVGPEPLERRLADIDRLGFNPRQEVAWPIDRLCAIRPEPPEFTAGGDGDAASMERFVRMDRVSDGRGRPLRLRVRPLREQVVVLRTRAPLGRRADEPRLSPPTAVHASRPAWRVHVAGWRGAAPGVAPWLLARAGQRMGYLVRVQADASPIGIGLRAWTQLLFTRMREGREGTPLVARTPFGEADLLLGVDPVETLRAVVEDPALRVASRPGTAAVVNTGRTVDELQGPASLEARSIAASRLGPALEATTADDRIVLDMAAACRRRFHSDRLVDAALLGLAFQRGLIPVTLDALNAAVAEAEAAGWGRVEEAVHFGRLVAVEPRVLDLGREERDDDARRLARRAILLHRRKGRDRFAALLRTSLEAMPGLMETHAGRRAARDFVTSVIRCDLWGGIDCARAYADRIVSLYRADTPESGRTLTRGAILPLASAMLIRDPFYVAAVVSSPEHRRRTRRWLDIRRARADVVERRYLTRVELFAFGRRVRAEVRTSDWPARLTQRIRPLVEDRFRGSRREREVREQMQRLVDRATAESPGNPDRRAHWEEVFRRLHRLALDNRFRGVGPGELRMMGGD